MIQALMAAPDIDTDKLLTLFELQEKYDSKVARESYYNALSDFGGMVDDIFYNKKASFGSGKASYGYATLQHMLKVIQPAMDACGLKASWTTGTGENALVVVTCIISHKLGHSESTSLAAAPDSSGNKNSIQAVKSTVSYLRRITLESMLGLAADEQDDDDGHQGGVPLVDDGDIKAIRDLMKKTKTEEATFLQAFAVDTLEALPKNQVAIATSLLAKKAGGAK